MNLALGLRPSIDRQQAMLPVAGTAFDDVVLSALGGRVGNDRGRFYPTLEAWYDGLHDRDPSPVRRGIHPD